MYITTKVDEMTLDMDMNMDMNLNSIVRAVQKSVPTWSILKFFFDQRLSQFIPLEHELQVLS